MKITSLDQLIKWNSQYFISTGLKKEPNKDKHPVLLEWFLDWYFKEAVFDVNISKRAFNEFVNFTYICTDLDMNLSIGKCLYSLTYCAIGIFYYNLINNFK